MVSWYEGDLGTDQSFSEVLGSVVPAYQFLLVDESCGRVSSNHLPVAENDVSEGVVIGW